MTGDPRSTARPPRASHAIGELARGSLVDQKYVIERLLGRGGMGTVYEATHLLLDRPVALKLLKSARLRDGRRLLREGKNLASIAHPNVVEIHDLGTTSDGSPYLVMELVRGVTLARHVETHGPLSVAEAVDLGMELLSALSAAHQRGIAHLDLKPDNVMLTVEDGQRHAKVLDFGLSLSLGDVEIAGTPGYLSPEQAHAKPADARADLFGWGATMFHALVGRPPYRATTIAEVRERLAAPLPSVKSLRADVPSALDAVIARALSLDPADRFIDASAALGALATALRGSLLPARGAYALVAEAEANTAAQCAAYARNAGLEVRVARDGVEAMSIVHRLGPPRVLLVNLSLPRCDGFALIKQLRALAGPQQTAIIAASTMPSLRAAARSLRTDRGIANIIPSLRSAELVEQVVTSALDRDEREAEPELDRDAVIRREGARLARIEQMGLVDDLPPDEGLQRLISDVADACGVPIAVISLILSDKQWFKAHVGLGGPLAEARGGSRELSFCQHAIEGSEVLVVPDARSHPVFADNPLVKSGAIGGYIGAPITTPDGAVIGTLCVIDKSPLELGGDVVDALAKLARRVAGELELRARKPASASEGRRADSARAEIEDAFGAADVAAMLLDPDRVVCRISDSLAQLMSLEKSEVMGKPRSEVLELFAQRFRDPDDYRKRVAALPRGPFAARAVLRPRAQERDLLWYAKPIELDGGVFHLEVFKLLA